VLKPDLADFADDIVARLTCKVDIQDFCADRTRQTPHLKFVSRHDRRLLLLRCLLNLTQPGWRRPPQRAGKHFDAN
jgi:hypothetical protein